MNITKAGVYLWAQGAFVFVVGPPPSGDRLGIIRLGGHREGAESPWDCAVRELREEAAVAIRHVPPLATYSIDNRQFRLTAWDGSPAPICFYPTAERNGFCPMYLARTDDLPRPVDAAGLIFMTPEQVRRMVAGEFRTLDQFRAADGKVIFGREVDESLPLAPYLHVTFLAELLQRHPELAGLCHA